MPLSASSGVSVEAVVAPEETESPLQGKIKESACPEKDAMTEAVFAAETPKSPFKVEEVPPTAEAVVAPEATESPLQGGIEESACPEKDTTTEAVFAAEAPKSPFKVEEVPPMAEAVVAPEVTESPLQGEIEELACPEKDATTEAVFAAEAPKSPFKVEEVPPTAEAVVAPEVIKSPLQDEIEESACPEKDASVTLPTTEAIFAAETSRSPFKVEEASPTAEAVEAAKVLECPLQGEVGDRDVEANRNPSEDASEAGYAYPIVAEAVTCPPIYLEISDEEVPAANEDQGTLPSYYPAPAPEQMDNPMPENIPAPAVAAMIRLMGAAPHTPETPDVHSLLEGQKRNEALIISLQYQLVRLEEELRDARKEAKADREGYEGIINDLLSSRHRHAGKDDSPSSPTKRRRW